jgi:hypothetical protein
MAKHKLSSRLYEEMVVLLYQCGVDFGDTGHSLITASEMNEIIADNLRASRARKISRAARGNQMLGVSTGRIRPKQEHPLKCQV